MRLGALMYIRKNVSGRLRKCRSHCSVTIIFVEGFQIIFLALYTFSTCNLKIHLFKKVKKILKKVIPRISTFFQNSKKLNFCKKIGFHIFLFNYLFAIRFWNAYIGLYAAVVERRRKIRRWPGKKLENRTGPEIWVTVSDQPWLLFPRQPHQHQEPIPILLRQTIR